MAPGTYVQCIGCGVSMVDKTVSDLKLPRLLSQSCCSHHDDAGCGVCVWIVATLEDATNPKYNLLIEGRIPLGCHGLLMSRSLENRSHSMLTGHYG
jgi:hypothetical protein